MKKILITVLLIVSVLLSLAGCVNEREVLVGTWTASVDISAALNKQWDESGYDIAVDEKCEIYLQFVFEEDGSCGAYVELEATMESMETYFTSIRESLAEVFYGEAEKNGMTPEQFDEALLALGGSTVEDMCREITDQILNGLEDSFEENEEIGLGFYRVEDGKLYIEDTEEELETTEDYAELKLDGNQLTMNLQEAFDDADFDEMEELGMDMSELVFTKAEN